MNNQYPKDTRCHCRRISDYDSIILFLSSLFACDIGKIFQVFVNEMYLYCASCKFVPYHEKMCVQDYQPGGTQLDLLSFRNQVVINLVYRSKRVHTTLYKCLVLPARSVLAHGVIQIFSWSGLLFSGQGA